MSVITSRRKTFASIAVLGATVLPGMAYASNVRLVEDKSCSVVVVQPGDSTWKIAGKYNVTLDVIASLNPHIQNLSMIYPGDEIAVGCGKDKPVIVPQSVVAANVSHPEWAQWRETKEPCGKSTCWTWQAIIIALYDAGFRGNDLITMAAIVPGESGRQIKAVGDDTIADSTWGPSVGVFQIRTVNKQKGTGGTRDIMKLNVSLAANAEAAFEIYESSKVRRDKGEIIRPAINIEANGKLVYGDKRLREAHDDWTCYQLGNHLGQLDTVRAIAAALGALS